MEISERHKRLIEDASAAFGTRGSLMSLWQEIAYHFYPEMADFTTNRYLGDEFADHLTTSYPLMARRTLGDSLSAMLRPIQLDTTSPGVWFNLRALDERKENTQTRRWLEHKTQVQRRAMYDKSANFVRATKEGDHTFVTFGQAPLYLDLNKTRDTLLYQCFHLRDVAWREDAEGKISQIYRKWKPSPLQLYGSFGDKISPKAKERLSQAPHTNSTAAFDRQGGGVNCLHVMIKAEDYELRDREGKKWRTPWVSVWIDTDNNWVMEEIGSWQRKYIIPRWVTIPGSQYASSPAVTAALPDARLIQAMTLTLLESSEKFADPPMIATEEVIRSDMQLFAGGTTWVDSAYDERLGAALRPAYEARANEGVRTGNELRMDVREQIAKAFFLDSLALPPASAKEMTAFEVSQRISEWIRRAMPIFEPMEFEYNGEICEQTFELLLRNGAFGSIDDMPQELRGADVHFKFESPLHEGADMRKGQKFLEAKAALVQAAELDPGVVPLLNATDTLRDVYKSIGVPAHWTRSRQEMQRLVAAQNAQREEQQVLEAGVGAADIAAKLGAASRDFAQGRATNPAA